MALSSGDIDENLVEFEKDEATYKATTNFVDEGNSPNNSTPNPITSSLTS